MGDHFVLLVDRLLTETTLEAAIKRENQLWQSTLSASDNNMVSPHEINANDRSSSSILVECRICHDEDEDLNMEAPCSCRGSLKFAHRRCVQRWCNEKGDIICEICHQQFKPGYSAPPPLFHYGGVPMSVRRELHHPQFIEMAASDREDTDFDEFSPLSQRSVRCCRLVAIIFIVLLVLRHTLPIVISGAEEYSMTLFTLLMLRTIGVLLPIYIIIRAFTAVQRRRHQQDSHFFFTSSDEENDLLHHRPRFLRIQ